MVVLVVAAAVVAVVSAPPAAAGPVDAGTVQAAYVAEIDAAKCAALVDKDGRPCGVVRRFPLKNIDRARGLSLVNDNLKGAPKSCTQKTRHAFVFETTKGVRVVDVNFGCHALDGKALSNKAETELATFMRLYGLVNGLNGR